MFGKTFSVGLSRVIINLLSNSVEAFDSHSFGSVSLNIEVNGSRLNILISDTGKGMTEEQIKKSVDGGWTSKTAGNGIGLSEAKKWVVSCGGAFDIRSTVGVGTNISFHLPIT